mgnify:CR=1 FL=1
MSDFYGELADDYDVLTGTAKRAGAARRFVGELHRRTGFTSALDAACGTGVFTRPLAEFANSVWGADLSREMLRRAERESGGAPVDIGWIEAPMQKLSGRLDHPVDLILCMGNSIPHLLTREDLATTIRGFATLLNPGGTLVMHQLNYDRVLARRERLVGVTRSDDDSFARFYDFQGERVVFNVIATHWEEGRAESTWHSTPLRPHRCAEILAILEQSGFQSPDLYADLAFSPYDRAESDLLIVQATKASGKT